MCLYLCNWVAFKILKWKVVCISVKIRLKIRRSPTCRFFLVRWCADVPHPCSLSACLAGNTFPNFQKTTSAGPIDFYEWAGSSWVVFVSHPADYTPVCTTELGLLAQLTPEFARRNTKVIAISVDSVEAHRGWIKDIQAREGLAGDFPYPIIADDNRELAVSLGMIDEVDKDAAGLPLNCRAVRCRHPFAKSSRAPMLTLSRQVFIISPDKKVKLSILYPATTGRNFECVYRTTP
jgi:1-Cys peroxiredoxin 6